MLQPYVKSVQLFQCPSEPNSPAAHLLERGYTDYVITEGMYGGFTPPYTRQVKDSMLTNTSVTILLAETFEANGNWRLAWRDFRDRAINGPVAGHERYHVAARRHLEGSNFTFADGHVKWYRPTALTCDDPADKPTFKLFPGDNESCY